MCSGVAVGEAGIGGERYTDQRNRRPSTGVAGGGGAHWGRRTAAAAAGRRAGGEGSICAPQHGHVAVGALYGPGRMERQYVQLDQPDGVPPLPLTGERTLPDVPEENYWFRRHLAVYERIAARIT